jgi:hypothetical protein
MVKPLRCHQRSEAVSAAVFGTTALRWKSADRSLRQALFHFTGKNC